MKSWLQNKFWALFFGFFAFFGTIFGCAFSSLMYKQYQLRNIGIHTTGAVIDMVFDSKGSASPVVSFTAQDGERIVYHSGTSSKPPEFNVGDRVGIWYDPKDPQHPTMGGIDTWLGPLITGIFFLIFAGIGYGGLLNRYFNKRRKEWLLQHGTPVEADFSEVRYNANLTINGAHPYVIVAQWLDKTTNKLYTFESENLWFNPRQYISQSSLRVLINPKNPAQYTMDTSFLPEAGN